MISENLTHLPSVIFAKISWLEKFPLYGTYTRFLKTDKLVVTGFFQIIYSALSVTKASYQNNA